ncbi:phage tail protein [Streptomyces sp. NPDC002033]|uniref:phage tail protein n=1 Tax=unclassified Streptomyces TaxID=2593676 RepID=UPI003330D38D
MSRFAPSSRTEALNHLRDRLPVHMLARDAESGGLLDALLGAVSGELSLLETDLEDLYDAWFVETCADWVVPYLADLVGLDDLPTDLGRDAGPRALVANTVAYRRRKGTVGVLEQVARDVTGWPARAVEFYRLLVTATHVNHTRTDRPATASVRDASRTERCGLDLAGARSLTPGLDPLAHLAEVRRIGSGRGRYGIPAVGVFLHPLKVHEIGAPGDPDATRSPTGTDDGWSQARRGTPGAGTYTFDPLGREAPLLAPSSDEERTEGTPRLAGEADLPVPLRPRRLLALLKAAREANAEPASLPLGIRLGSTGRDLRPGAIRVRGLEGLDPDPAVEFQAVVDPVHGTLTCYRNCALHDTEVFVRYAYGALADVGAGSHDRSEMHEVALATSRCRPVGDDAERIVGHVAVRAAATNANDEVSTVQKGLTKARTALGKLDAAHRDGAAYVVSVADSATYPETAPSVTIPDRTRLVLVAAVRPQGLPPAEDAAALVPLAYVPEGVRPHLLGGLTLGGGTGSSVVLDGLAIEGDLVVAPGALACLTISQCTVAGRLRVEQKGANDNGELQIRVIRSVLTGGDPADGPTIDLNALVPTLCVSDSSIDGEVTGAAAHASFEGSTVRGDVTVRSLDGSSCVFDGTVTVEHRQTGCLRYSYTGPASRTPRRYRCVPVEAHGEAPGPVYSSVDPGSPVYLALARDCPEGIRTGGENGAEMGVHHHLRRPLRIAAAARALAPYLPVQIEFGTCGS